MPGLDRQRQARTLTVTRSAPSRQQEVWSNVSRMVNVLSANVGAPVASTQSGTSLQLALENIDAARRFRRPIRSMAA